MLANSGEDDVIFSTESDYAANIELAEAVAQRSLPKGYDYDWAGISKDEAEQGNTAIVIFVVCLVFVYGFGYRRNHAVAYCRRLQRLCQRRLQSICPRHRQNL